MIRDSHAHDEIVDRLTEQLTPVRPLASPWKTLAAWIALALVTVAIAAAVGLRNDLGVALDRIRYVGDVAILLSGAGLAATLALLLGVPGRLGGTRARRLALGLLGLALAAGLLGEPIDGSPALWEQVRCLACVGVFGIVPFIALYAGVRRGAPLDGRTTALCIGAAAFLVGAAAVRIACPFDGVSHLVLWHGMPVALWTLGSAALVGPRLERWLPSAERHVDG